MTNNPDKTEPIASPCIDVCSIDEKNGQCMGCFRTLQEIAEWPHLDEEEKYAIIQELNMRKQKKV